MVIQRQMRMLDDGPTPRTLRNPLLISAACVGSRAPEVHT
jgi:hypothetical protein